MIAVTAAEYVEREVLPHLPEILALNYETIRDALRKAGRIRNAAHPLLRNRGTEEEIPAEVRLR